MASQAMHEFAAMSRADRAGASHGGDVAAMRSDLETQPAQRAIRTNVTRGAGTLGGRPALWVRPPQVRRDQCLPYWHGGGYVMGSLAPDAELMARLAAATPIRGVGLAYRLGPEAR